MNAIINYRRNHGFTMIELLLAIGLIIVLSSFALPVTRFMQVRSEMDNTLTTVAQTLRRAQLLSQTNERDSTWGMRVQSGSVTLFRGNTYASRDTSFDEIVTTSSSITPSGITEVVYSKMTGLPNTTGTLTLSATNDTRTIVINAKGALTY